MTTQLHTFDRIAKPKPAPATSWWLELPPDGFTAAAVGEQARMASSKFGGAGKPYNGQEGS